jgi:hypothetical protein
MNVVIPIGYGPFPPFSIAIPANAGIRKAAGIDWIPAFAGMPGMIERPACNALL